MKAIRRGPAGAVWLFLFVFVCAGEPGKAEAQQVIIAAASNVQFAARDLVAAFENHTGSELDLVFGSSGKLTAQISNGAPFALFLSADLDYPQALIRAGFGLKVRIFALGSLVLASSRYTDLHEGLVLLRAPRIKRIALADPRIAPYGAQSLNALNALGLGQVVRHKLVYGKNIAQASQYIISGSVDLGITAKSIVMAQPPQSQLTWVPLDTASYEPIRQGALILRHGQEHHAGVTTAFFDFLFSGPAREILHRHGYRTP